MADSDMKHYFVDGEEVDRQVFEETWDSEDFGTMIDGKWYPVPAPIDCGKWQGIHEYNILLGEGRLSR